MADPNCSYILQLLLQVQDRAAQYDRELRAIRSPRCEHEGKLANVNARLDEALCLYSSQSAVDRSELRKKIADYGRELEKLDIIYKEGLKDAEASYKHRIEVVWNGFCQELIVSLGPTLVQETLQKLLGEDMQQDRTHGSVKNLQKDSASASPAPSAREKTGINGDTNKVSTPCSIGEIPMLTSQAQTKAQWLSSRTAEKEA